VATINDVAARAGVSPTTVSRVFARPELVHIDTRQRVTAVAQQLGYTPNRLARSLAMGRSGNIGLVVPDIANPFFPPLIKAVQQQARLGDYALFIADTDEHARDEFPLVRAMAKQVDGLVLTSPRMSDAQIREVIELVPTVVINRNLTGALAVLIPTTDGIEQAIDHLVALGHRSVVYLAGPATSWSDVQRRNGVSRACGRHGIRFAELGPFEPRFESGLRAGDLVLAEGTTAAIAYDDLVALGLINLLTDRGVRVGADVSVIGVDDSPFSSMSSPPLTSVRVPSAAAGSTAVRLLLDMLSRQGVRRIVRH
jgi:DNA-binding LacI/PurR family transcriptional regulator